MSIFELFNAPIFGERIQEAPPEPARQSRAEAEQTPVRYALDAQDNLLRAGFTPEQAFAGALNVLADERPAIANASGRARKASRKKCNWLRAVAAQIALEEQDDRSRPLA